ncbi:NUDIX domain-containing protein [Streptococcus gallinaceus]|uniref:8-oxo-dGTP pyrophosphatase MutT (NUDIX family) n=1 Tax=Streptococcus gallinaceus TaxID=165758 RepID=A0ABV2JHS0_9STRE
MRATVIILDESERYAIAIGRMKNGRSYLVWPGGRIEEGETPEQAAVREIQEELAISLEMSSLEQLEATAEGITFLAATKLQHQPLEIGGEERERMTEYNAYQPYWQKLAHLDQVSIFPLISLERIKKK